MSDLISRQAAIDVLSQYPFEKVVNCISILEELPSAQPERKKGKWVEFEYGNHTWHKCSLCGVADKYKDEVKREDGTIGVLTSIRNFCPNCGADMRGEEC